VAFSLQQNLQIIDNIIAMRKTVRSTRNPLALEYLYSAYQQKRICWLLPWTAAQWRSNETRKLFYSSSAAAGALTMFLLAAPAGAQTHRLEKRFAVDGKPIVILHNPSGRIHVKSADRPEVLLVAQYSSSRVIIDTEQADNRVEIVTSLSGPPASSPADLRADLDITVPAN
jgi:hypothetical protein